MCASSRSLLAAACIVAGCASTHDAAPASGDLTLGFGVDAPASGDAYTCYGFDASPVAGRWLRSIEWTTPAPGAVALHHAALYAFPQDFPDGPVSCDAMPESWTMHIWVPGGDSLTLPDGVAVALPPGTRRFVVQTHVLRFASGPAASASARLETTDVAPARVAAWLTAYGSVPAIRPNTEETSTTTCTAPAAMHVVRALPHMHRLGRSFHSGVVHADGSETTLVDVPTWDFDQQTTYDVDVDVAAGEGVRTDCVWFNPTDQYVLPGTATSDEMCGDGLIVWPAEAAAWQGCL